MPCIDFFVVVEIVFCGVCIHLAARRFLKGCVSDGRVKFRQLRHQIIHSFRGSLQRFGGRTGTGAGWKRMGRCIVMRGTRAVIVFCKIALTGLVVTIHLWRGRPLAGRRSTSEIRRRSPTSSWTWAGTRSAGWSWTRTQGGSPSGTWTWGFAIVFIIRA